MSWIYILIASIFEVAWTYSLKFMKFSELKTLRWDTFYRVDSGLPILLPLIGYIAFGIGNIYFFQLALKKIPMATTFAVWTALALVLMKISEVLFFKEKIAFMELFFMFLITVGIVGLKVYASN